MSRQDFLGDNPAAVSAGDGSQARPCRIADEPEAREPGRVRHGPLVGVGQTLPETSHRAARPARETLICSWRGQFAHDGTFS